MGSAEDTRKAIQDFIAPDLRAFAVRLNVVGEEINLRFDHLHRTMDEKFASVERLAALRHETMMATIATMATMAANHASVMNVLEVEKPLSRL